jgi:hypothetical protein
MTWRKRTIMEMAREAGFEQVGHDSFQELTARVEAFAALVRGDEREKFLAALRQLHDSYSLASDPSAIRARGARKPTEGA